MPVTSDDESTSIQRQAAEWLARQQSGRWSAQDQEELQSWLDADPLHARHFQNLKRFWSDMDQARSSLKDLRHAALSHSPARRAAPLSKLVGALTTATTLCLLVGGIHWYWIGNENHYTTTKGERLSVTLADGSDLLLNTDSSVAVRYSGSRRHVRLIRGEVLFNVAHERFRPFAVQAGQGEVLDIGTRFSVYVRPERVTVDVLEGRVEMTTDRIPRKSLSAGQLAAYDGEGRLLSGYAGDPQDHTAWEHGTLVFQETPLAEVADQLARYHPIRFQLSDRRLEAVKVSGRFRADNLPVLLKTLQASFPIVVTQIDSGVIRFDPRPR